MDQKTFLHQLRDSKLLADDRFAEVARRCATDMPLGELTAALVDQGWLTAYQVEQLCAGKGKRLCLGQYRIVAELGRGGFGCVFKAVHAIMNRTVALKVIAPELVEDGWVRASFLREVQATTQLSHPNIALAYDANEVDDVLLLAMEFVDGPTLEALVRTQGPLPISFACALLHQVTRALQYAHEKGMVHRDIKPANLLIPREAAGGSSTDSNGFRSSPNGTATPLVKVVDFGLARLHEKGDGNTIHNKGFLGTPHYVSPEQARSVHDVDIRSDLYSLGCTFYFALTGQPPFRGKGPLEIVLQHLEKEAAPLESLRPDVPPALAGIIRRLMAKTPEQRFQTPADLAAELSFLTGFAPMIAMPPQPPAPAPSSSPAGVSRGNGLGGLERSAAGRIDSPSYPASAAGSLLGRIANPSPSMKGRTGGPAYLSLLPSGNSIGTAPALADEEAEAMPRTICSLPDAVIIEKEVADAATAVEDLDTSQVQPEDCGSQIADGRLEAQGSGANLQSAIGHRPSAPAAADAQPTAELERAFREFWRQWAGVIGRAVRNRPAGIDEEDYRWLHAKLMEICKRRKTDPLCQRSENRAAPWLSLQTLAAMDAQTRTCLWSGCQEINRELGLSGRSWLAVAGVLLFLAAGAIGILLAQPAIVTRNLPSLSGIWPYLQDHPTLAVAAAAPVLVILSVFGIGRFFRA